MISSETVCTPVDRILEEQQCLTAVDRFARLHDLNAPPAQQKYYRDLIPLTRPKAGQQYAFEVDLDRCSGCQACVTACHALNGLDDDESWRDVGLLFSDDWRTPYQAPVTTACHHCVDPGCLSGCPVLAYDKDPVTGIVRHLDDQCIGCQYCVMKCPYEVPQYSKSRGIVRKCDMCSSRLGHSEAPACVQACPSQAIRITLVDQTALTKRYRDGSGGDFLPAAPPPEHTVPTTRYISSRPIPRGVLAGDHARVVPGPSHLPLVFMLVFSQLAVGAALAALFAAQKGLLELATAASGVLAVGFGTLHLGRPLKAWRAFLGWRTSWFSREVIVFAGLIPLAVLATASSQIPSLAAFQALLALATALVGLLGVTCSAMIYADTRREFWSVSRSLERFLGTTVLLGSSLALTLTALQEPVPTHVLAVSAILLGLVATVKLALEHRIFRHLVDEETRTTTTLNRTARLLANELGLRNRIRIFSGACGGVLLPAVTVLASYAGHDHAPWTAVASFALCLTGELLERHLYFAAVSPARMPGGLVA